MLTVWLFKVCFKLMHFILCKQKKMVQKARSQTGFEQRLHISLDLSPEEDEELKKLFARYF